ncbi:hydrolase [Streptomyces sp. NBC_01280]|uniref:alpha/beta hydrolase family protein n=1 Tax=Streptomyces sp. NBC_01280 TaxID=2903810 RepID=UPI002E3789EC|nr:hydrolase [Streptomyces sp. NBC_01280]
MDTNGDTKTTMTSRRRVLAASALGLTWAATGGPGATASAMAADSTPRTARMKLPAPTGPYGVGTVSLRLVDRRRADPWVAGRRRELMVDVRYPARSVASHPRVPQMTKGEAAGFDRVNNFGDLPKGRVDWSGTQTFAHLGAPPDRRGPRPVVLYSPGVGDPRTLGTTLTDELASHGYVVVAIDHTYDASAVEFPGGRVETTLLPQEFDRAQQAGPAAVVALMRKTCAVRVADTRFVLDEVERAFATGRLERAPIGMFGQSAGGFAALQTMHDDGRIAAAADLDGVLAHVSDDHDEGELSSVARDGVDGPFLLMGMDGDDRTNVPSWRALWEHSDGWHRDLVLRGAQHATYTDATSLIPQIARQLGLPGETVTGLVGTVPAARAIAAQRAYVTAFFDRWLRGRTGGHFLDGPSSRYPQVRFV